MRTIAGLWTDYVETLEARDPTIPDTVTEAMRRVFYTGVAAGLFLLHSVPRETLEAELGTALAVVLTAEARRTQ
ncbi:MAG TPA: hypothetical protein VGF65_16325 [Mycobacterium sp.]